MQIPIDSYTLANGLRVMLSEDHSAPIVGVNLIYHVGSANERAGRTGFAHLFEHMLFQGSADVAANEHFELIQRAGGTLNGSTWLDRTTYYDVVPSHLCELVLWLEANRMGNLLSAMTQEKLDTQRDVVKNERRWSVLADRVHGRSLQGEPRGYRGILSRVLCARKRGDFHYGRFRRRTGAPMGGAILRTHFRRRLAAAAT
jgi:hypothetical protein